MTHVQKAWIHSSLVLARVIPSAAPNVEFLVTNFCTDCLHQRVMSTSNSLSPRHSKSMDSVSVCPEPATHINLRSRWHESSGKFTSI